MSEFDIARGFAGGIPPIPADDAAKRLISFCCSPGSGWRSYDLAGVAARSAGHFDSVAPWSLLWADALAGRLSVQDISGFTLERRAIFAELISAVPAGKDLAEFDELERQTVHKLCTFGYSGVWAPKSTKVASLYRPRGVPVLDGYVAMAFGFHRTGFSEGKAPRWHRIACVIDALATYLNEHREQIIELRQSARVYVKDIDLASDLRLLDIVIWCSQDDRQERPGKKQNAWLDAPVRTYESPASKSIRVISESRNQV